MNKKLYVFLARNAIHLRELIVKTANIFVPEKYTVIQKIQLFNFQYILKAAVELHIADLLQNKTKSIEELAAESNTNPESLYRLLRALSGEGFFKELPEKKFRNTKASKFLCENHKNSIKYLVLHQLNNGIVEMLMNLKYSVKTGIPASSKVFGTDPFDYMSKHPENNELYNKAMADGTKLLSSVLSLYFPFYKYKTIADVGGGNGLLLSLILTKKNHSEGFVIDLPHVIEKPHNNIISRKLKDKIIFVPENITENVSINADLYILKNVLHLFGDNKCITILKNIKASAHTGSKILIIEMSLCEPNKYSYGKLYDIQMLVTMKNGKERSSEEYQMLFNKAGLRFIKEIKTIGQFSIFEAKV